MPPNTDLPPLARVQEGLLRLYEGNLARLSPQYRDALQVLAEVVPEPKPQPPWKSESNFEWFKILQDFCKDTGAFTITVRYQHELIDFPRGEGWKACIVLDKTSEGHRRFPDRGGAASEHNTLEVPSPELAARYSPLGRQRYARSWASQVAVFTLIRLQIAQLCQPVGADGGGQYRLMPVDQPMDA